MVPRDGNGGADRSINAQPGPGYSPHMQDAIILLVRIEAP